MKVGITGGQGFVGTHLKNYLGLKENIEVSIFEGDLIQNKDLLNTFASSQEVIVHLAGVNRHENQDELYRLNIGLMQSLIDACETTSSNPTIIFSSSTQEDLDNLYGKSKKEAGNLLLHWGQENKARVVNMVVPNVFGPFGKPNYNSVTATFCYKIARGENPTIINDSEVKLIYINELIEDIYHLIVDTTKVGKVYLEARHSLKVSELLNKLNNFKEIYMEKKSFPKLDSPTDLALFNTFRCYIPEDFYPVKFKINMDGRGNFVEIARTNSIGQFSFSTTVPGITRGNHFHTRKAERFAVIKGRASIKLRKIGTDDVIEYILDGNEPAYVDMPIWHTHNITNIGGEELLTLFWINEPYDAADPDTWMVEV